MVTSGLLVVEAKCLKYWFGHGNLLSRPNHAPIRCVCQVYNYPNFPHRSAPGRRPVPLNPHESIRAFSDDIEGENATVRRVFSFDVVAERPNTFVWVQGHGPPTGCAPMGKIWVIIYLTNAANRSMIRPR